MKKATGIITLVWISVLLGAWPTAQAPATDAPTPSADPNKPEWAYAAAPLPPGGRAGGGGRGAGGGGRGAGAPVDTTKFTLPGSKFSFTRAEVRNSFAPADWFPEDHPAMPEVVAHGRAPDARACAFCHMPNGKGRPENAPVAGLPKDYIVQQMVDFASGDRVTAEARKPNDMTQRSPRTSRGRISTRPPSTSRR